MQERPGHWSLYTSGITIGDGMTEETQPATKADIAELRGATESSIAGLRGATESSIAALRAEAKADNAALRAEFHRSSDDLRGRMESMETRIEELIRDAQTELLKGFYGFTQTVQQRFQEQEQTETSLKRRMSILEERFLEIEKRINMPPAA